MANHHLKNRELSLKAKGLLSVMLSLPENWDYTLRGLACISLESVDAIREAVRELEKAGYVVRSRTRNSQGQLKQMEYTIYELPHLPTEENPALENLMQAEPIQDDSVQEKPVQENPLQLSTQVSNTYPEKIELLNKNGAIPYPSNPHPISAWREQVRRNISYDVLVQDSRYDRKRLDEIVELMAEILATNRTTICVAGDDYPADEVRDRLLQLNSLHIEYVFECLQTEIIADLRRDMGDDQAILAMIDTNLKQRQNLLPSERARAYRMMRDTLKHQGKKIELDAKGTRATKEKIAQLYGDSGRKVSRFIRLTYLIPDLLDYVDRKKLKLGPAIQISFLEEDVQKWIAEDYACMQRFPSVEQIQKMRKAQESGTLNFDAFADILSEQPEPKKEDDYLARIRDEYFPDLMKKDVEEKIEELIEEYFHRMRMEY